MVAQCWRDVLPMIAADFRQMLRLDYLCLYPFCICMIVLSDEEADDKYSPLLSIPSIMNDAQNECTYASSPVSRITREYGFSAQQRGIEVAMASVSYATP